MIIKVEPTGHVDFDGHRWRCAFGKNGITDSKREGDGATPCGTFTLGRVYFRPDRVDAPETALHVETLAPNMGWCDDPGHKDYNQQIELPHPARHELLWRDDEIYDVVVAIDYNTFPVEPGLGSAIFLHVAKPDYTPTEGCIALKQKDLLELLRLCDDHAAITIPSP